MDHSAELNQEVCLPIPQGRLEEIINNKLGTKSKIANTQCEIIGEGKGFLSIITKVDLTWSGSDTDEEKLPKAVIVKKPSTERMKGVEIMDKVFSDPNMLGHLHNRECDAYQFLNRYKPPPFPMARSFLAEKMRLEDPSKGLLILEHLGNNCRSLHFNEDPSLEKIMTVVGYIASLQAYGFEHPDYRESIGEMPMDIYDIMFDGVYEAAAVLREKHPERFDISDERITQVLAECMEEADVFRNPKKYGYTEVLCLGDTQPNNLLWKLNADDTLSDEVEALLDFQMAHTGLCCYDIGLLSIVSVPLDIWQNNEENIFNHYLNVLKSKTSKEVPITVEEIRRAYTLQRKVWGLGSFGMVKSMDVVGEKAGIRPEMVDDMIDRMLAGIRETKQ